VFEQQKLDIFPYEETLNYLGRDIHYQTLIDKLGPLLTEERRTKIEQAVISRTFSLTLVGENIYDMGNLNAVMRTAENFGLQSLHVIPSEKTKYSQRITQGADKWLDIHTTEDSKQCYSQLKKRGYTLVSTHLASNSVSIEDLPFDKPLAFILGNEKVGVSELGLEMSDYNCIIPTVGLSQSFNISVAASVIMAYTFFLRRRLNHRQSGDLSPLQQNILKAIYFAKTTDNFERHL
jgi:tRNA (guanosine-2'-O-)-methyltransferase